MLDDALFDVEAWLANEIATEFARAEGVAFIKGTGANQPLGFLSSPNAITSDATRPVGTLPQRNDNDGESVTLATAGAFRDVDDTDTLLKLTFRILKNILKFK